MKRSGAARPEVPRLLAPLVALLALLAACGGDDGGSADDSGPAPTQQPQFTGIAVLQLDPEAAAAISDPITAVADVLALRLNALGIPASASPTSDNTMQVSFESDLSAERITEALSADIQFREPVIDSEGKVICTAPDGSEVAVHPVGVTGSSGADGRFSMDCYDPDGLRVGEAKWQQAAGQGDGEPVPLTAAMIVPGSSQATQFPGGPPTLVLAFNQEGRAALADITDRLAGYPLGIFLEERPIIAPLVGDLLIDTGQLTVRHAPPEDLPLLEAIAQGGALPVPVEVLNIQVP